MTIPKRGFVAASTGLAFVCLAALFGAAQAEEPRYQPWGRDQGAEDRTQKVVGELRGLIDQADRSRSADPQFLRDLKNLAQRYDRPRRGQVLFDDFSDGEFTTNPTWTVAAGRYVVDKGYGLRAVATAQPQAQPAPRRGSAEDVAREVGSILSLALGGRQQGRDAPAVPPSQEEHAQIFVVKPIPNAFAIRIQVSSWQAAGEFDFGPYQGADRAGGYRLLYRPGGQPALALVRLSRGAVSVVKSYDGALGLEDQSVHEIEWSRDRSGEMVVRVDGRETLRIADQAIRQAFDGFAVGSRGGDVALARVSIDGAN